MPWDAATIGAIFTGVGGIAMAFAQAYVIIQQGRIKEQVQSGIDMSKKNNDDIQIRSKEITESVEQVKSDVFRVAEQSKVIHLLVDGQGEKLAKLSNDAGFTRGLAAGARSERENPTTGDLPTARDIPPVSGDVTIKGDIRISKPGEKK